MSEREVDVLVIGAGMGGMSAALFAAIEGLDVLLCEKTGAVGGTTATSAGTVWIPGGSEEELEAAAQYLDAEIGNRGDRALREAYLASGREALEMLQRGTAVKFRAVSPHPDYHPDLPGWRASGRAFAPLPFDGRVLGRDFALVRPPIAPFMVLGGLMLGKDDIPHFVKPFGSLASFNHVARIVLRHGVDRLRYRRGARLVMGNALVARLLFSLRQAKVPLALDCRLVELLRGERGAIVERNGTRERIAARRGVVLATGGFPQEPLLRATLVTEPKANYSMGFAGNTGDGMTVARDVGATFGEARSHPAFWVPVSVLRENGRETRFPHVLLDRAKPGLIAVNGSGRRFVNEAASYHDFVEGMLRAGSEKAWLVCDRAFVRDYGVGLVHPGSSERALRRFIDAGYLHTAATFADLGRAIGVDAAALEATVARHNRSAATGVDEEFGKGSNALNRHNGDPANKPNPCLRPLAVPPFFAVAVHPGDLGTSVGLRTDADAQVLGANGVPIGGLYACGNDMDSVMAGSYPGPGITLGPAMVFAYRAVKHMAEMRR